LAPALILDANDGDFPNGWLARDQVLDLQGGDPLPAALSILEPLR
jgi:hypothetical protein